MSDQRKVESDEHASRPGPITFVLLAALVCVYFVVAYRPQIETFLGIQF